jgi:hypothetical protein
MVNCKHELVSGKEAYVHDQVVQKVCLQMKDACQTFPGGGTIWIRKTLVCSEASYQKHLILQQLGELGRKPQITHVYSAARQFPRSLCYEQWHPDKVSRARWYHSKYAVC